MRYRLYSALLTIVLALLFAELALPMTDGFAAELLRYGIPAGHPLFDELEAIQYLFAVAAAGCGVLVSFVLINLFFEQGKSESK